MDHHHQLVHNPNKEDVLLGRGRRVHGWEGNVRFRRLCEAEAASYVAAAADNKRNGLTTTTTKDSVVMDIVARVHGAGGRFLSPRDMSLPAGAAVVWQTVPPNVIRTKVKQACRDTVRSRQKGGTGEGTSKAKSQEERLSTNPRRQHKRPRKDRSTADSARSASSLVVEPLQKEQVSSTTSPFALSSSALPLHLSSTSSAASDDNKTTNPKPELYQPSDRELEQALLSWCAAQEKARTTGTVADTATVAAESASPDAAAVLAAAVRAELTTSSAKPTIPDEPSPTFPRPALFMGDTKASMADDADRHRRHHLPSFRDVSSWIPFSSSSLSLSSGERDCHSVSDLRYGGIGNNNINDLNRPMNLSAEGMPHQLVVHSPHYFVPTIGGLSAEASSPGFPAPPLHHHHHHRRRQRGWWEDRDSSGQLATMLHLAHPHHQQLQRQPASIHQAAAAAAADGPTALDAFLFGRL